MGTGAANMIYVGIDPGQKGGVAFIWDAEQSCEVFPMPDTRNQLCKMLKEYCNGAAVTCTIEAVHSMPKQGVSSTFKFGKGYGEILGICTALGFQIIEPTPQAWKKAMLAGTDKSKDASIQVAENNFPDVRLVPKGCRKPNNGMAEALLLAEYGRITKQMKGAAP
jgi:hypothetical protein